MTDFGVLSQLQNLKRKTDEQNVEILKRARLNDSKQKIVAESLNTEQIFLNTDENTITINSESQSVPSVYTIPDTGVNANFVMTEGSQIINGDTTFSTAPTMEGTNITNKPIVTGTTGTLTAGRGGTGQSAYLKGDLIYASADNVLSKLPIGSANNVLVVSDGMVPSYAYVGSSKILTGENVYQEGDILIAKTTTTLDTLTAKGSGHVLVGSSSSDLKSAWKKPRVKRLILDDTMPIPREYQPTADGMLYMSVLVVGGGGGGGGAKNSGAATTGAAAGGGGGGGASISAWFYNGIDFASPIPLTFGGGGTAGTSTTDGGPGGTTSFGTYLSASGGLGGTTSITTATNTLAEGGMGGSAFSVGGNPDGAQTKIYGGGGGTGFATAIAGGTASAIGGIGGSSVFPAARRTSTAFATVGVSQTTEGEVNVNYGAGGSGGANAAINATTTAVNGGVGIKGVIIIDEYYYVS